MSTFLVGMYKCFWMGWYWRFAWVNKHVCLLKIHTSAFMFSVKPVYASVLLLASFYYFFIGLKFAFSCLLCYACHGLWVWKKERKKLIRCPALPHRKSFPYIPPTLPGLKAFQILSHLQEPSFSYDLGFQLRLVSRHCPTFVFFLT